MKYSHYQEAIFDYAVSGSGSAKINAVAGSGKTATGVEMCNRISTFGRYMAFNRHIAQELSRKVNYFECCTYNSFGNRILREHFESMPKVSDRKDANLLRYFVLGNPSSGSEDLKRYYENVGSVCRLISLFKNKLVLSVEEAQAELPGILERYDIDLPDEDLLFDTFEKSITDHKYISYDDQKYLPLLLGLEIPQSDFLVIDEAQDTCDVERELMLRSCSGRVFIFGDPWQCIYSFKGTTPDAMSQFDGIDLPLSICYRCSAAVIREAQKIVPHIEAWKSGGVVDTIKFEKFYDMAVPGDMVLARCTLDLVESCLQFIRAGIPAYVKGREIGDKLLKLVDKIGGPDDKFLGNLDIWYDSEYRRFVDTNELALILLADKRDTLRVLWDGSIVDLVKKIEKLFGEENGICHMTVHKAKGLQAKRVFLLKPDKIPHPRAKKPWMKEEEMRLLYVAITRAQEDLFYVQ